MTRRSQREDRTDFPPFARRKPLDGPSGDVDRRQPYDEEPNDLRFADLERAGVSRSGRADEGSGRNGDVMTQSTNPTPTGATAVADREVTILLKSQHEQVKMLFSQLGQPGADVESVFCDLRRMLAVHETAEEEVVYPVLRRVDGGDAIVEARLEEESAAKQAIADLEAMEPNSAEFRTACEQLRADVLAHAEAEEHEVFPMLRRTQDVEQLEKMARRVKTAESVAPTHPHPHGPESATGNMLVGPFVAIADRVRDAMRSES